MELTFNLNIGPEAFWIVPLNLLFIILTIDGIYKGKFNIYEKAFGVLVIAYDILAIYTQLFYVILPFSNENANLVGNIIWIIALFIIFRPRKKLAVN